MSVAETCTIPAYQGMMEPSVNSDSESRLGPEDIVACVLDTIIENAVERSTVNVKLNVLRNCNEGPVESVVAEDLEESNNQERAAEKVTVKNKLKKKVKRLSRKQLEKFISEKAQELVKAQSEVKKLQTNCQSLKKEVKEWKDKSDSLAKSCSNLAKLVKLNLEGNQSRTQPSKQVRSVGVQVRITALHTTSPTKRQLDEREDSCAKKAATTQHHVTTPTQKAVTTQKSVHTQKTTQQNITTQKHVSPVQRVIPQKVEDDEISIVKQVARLPPLPPSNVVQNGSGSGSGSPPKPDLKLTQTGAGLEVYWTYQGGCSHTQISSYELYAYQDTGRPLAAASWKKVGDIKSIPLPIRCTLSHFKSGSSYFFVVRAKDLKGHFGKFSEVQKICLK